MAKTVRCGESGSEADDDAEELEPLELVEPTPLPSRPVSKGRTFRREDAFRVADFLAEEECPFCGEYPHNNPGCACEKSFNSAFRAPSRETAHFCNQLGGRKSSRHESIAWVCDKANTALRNDVDFQKYLQEHGVVVVKLPNCSADSSQPALGDSAVV